MDIEGQIPPPLPLQKVPPFAGFGKEGIGEIFITICLFNYGLLIENRKSNATGVPAIPKHVCGDFVVFPKPPPLEKGD